MESVIARNPDRKMKSTRLVIVAALVAVVASVVAVLTIPDLWVIRLSVVNALPTDLTDDPGLAANVLDGELSKQQTPEAQARVLVWFSVHHNYMNIHENERIVEMVLYSNFRSEYIHQLTALLESPEGAQLPKSRVESLRTYLEAAKNDK